MHPINSRKVLVESKLKGKCDCFSLVAVPNQTAHYHEFLNEVNVAVQKVKPNAFIVL